MSATSYKTLYKFFVICYTFKDNIYTHQKKKPTEKKLYSNYLHKVRERCIHWSTFVFFSFNAPHPQGLSLEWLQFGVEIVTRQEFYVQIVKPPD